VTVYYLSRVNFFTITL